MSKSVGVFRGIRRPVRARRVDSKRVIVSYHFFAHYREAIVRELSNSNKYDYLFASDTRDPGDGTIRSLEMGEDQTAFKLVRCRRLIGPILWQPGVVRLSLQRGVGTVIFLGNMYLVWTWLAVLICRVRGVRTLYWSHGWRTKEAGVKGWLRKRFYGLADGILVYEHGAKSIAIEEGFDPRDIYVVYNSIPLAERRVDDPLPEKVEVLRLELFTGGGPVVICSSRLIKSRNIELLIEAAALLRGRSQEINLLFVGDGPEKEVLRDLAEEEGVPSAFVGACYDEDVLAAYFGLASLTVSPGPIGLLVIHSFAHGVPVVASDNAAVQGPEWGAIIEGVTGGYFVDGDAESLADEIECWLASGILPTTKAACHAVVDDAYNPSFQRLTIERAVAGLEACDLNRTWVRMGYEGPPDDRGSGNDLTI